MRMFVRIMAAVLAASLVIGLSACTDKDTAAKVNGKSVKKSDIDKQIEQIKKSYPQMFQGADGEGRLNDLRKRILDSLVDAALIEQYAEKEGIKVSDSDIDKQITQLRQGFKDKKAFDDALQKAGIDEKQLREQVEKQLVQQKVIDAITKSIKVTDKQVADYYAKNKADFNVQATVRAAHILFKDSDKKNAEKVLGEVKGGGDFAALAKKYSQDQGSASKGGDLGWPTSPYVQQFQEAADKLKPGEISELVKTPFGWHIIKVIDKRPARQQKLSEVKEQIKQLLVQQQQSDAYQKFITGLRKDAKIEIVDPGLKGSTKSDGSKQPEGSSTGGK